MQILPQEIEGLIFIEPAVLKDGRGSFSRVFCMKEFEKFGFAKTFVQSNISYNTRKGTFRGLHFQRHPHAEAKLIRCLKGSIRDIIIDLRPSSKTYLQTFQTVLSEENQAMLFIPEGCAHGFVTLEDNSVVLYNHTAYYEAKYESGLRHDDPYLKLELPVSVSTISERDKNHPLITKDFKGYL